MATLLNRIIKISIYLLVFLLPLFWLPFSYQPFEFNKQYLLFFLVSLAFFAWLSRMVLVDKELRFKKTPLDLFVVAFIFIAILSAIFSVDKISSIFGFYGRFSDGLIGLLSLTTFYFLITNNTTTRDPTSGNIISLNNLLKAFLWSVFFVIFLSYLSIFGVLAKFNLGRSFNPAAGSLEGLAVFLSLLSVLLVGFILFRPINPIRPIRPIKLIPYWLLLIASLFLLIIIDFTPAWLVIVVSFFLLTAFAFWKRMFKENIRLILPILLMVLAVVFIVSNARTLLPADLGRLPQEQVLGQGTSWRISLETLTDNPKNGFLGSGIGTFFHDFSKQKPPEFNKSPLWQMRFDRPGNHISEITATLGFLGILSYLALIGFFLIISYFLFKELSSLKLPLLVTFLALLIAQLVYYQNTILAFTFWLVLALSVASWQPPTKSWWWGEKIFSLKESPELSRVFTVLLIIIGLAIAGSYYFAQKIYRADIIYAKSQKMALGPERTALIEKAVELNPYFAQYQTILARAYLDGALKEMRKPADQQDSVILQKAVAKAIDTAKVASVKGPGQVSTWETLAMIYRDIGLFAAGATEWGIKSFEKALALEPTNPVLHTELGKLLIINNPEKARESFTQAIELKPDYLPALIQSALIYEREENLDEAIRKMEDLAKPHPFNVEVLFQLGRLYFNADRIDDAISQLERVVDIMPNHSNAHYSLGAAYQKKSQKEKAIKEFEKVLELNPGNQDVIAKLKELKKK